MKCLVPTARPREASTGALLFGFPRGQYTSRYASYGQAENNSDNADADFSRDFFGNEESRRRQVDREIDVQWREGYGMPHRDIREVHLARGPGVIGDTIGTCFTSAVI